jgi:hypothetical protein
MKRAGLSTRWQKRRKKIGARQKEADFDAESAPCQG